MSSLPLTRNQIFDVSTLIGRAQRDAAIMLATLRGEGSGVSGAPVSGFQEGGRSSQQHHHHQHQHNSRDAALMPPTPSLFSNSSPAAGSLHNASSSSSQHQQPSSSSPFSTSSSSYTIADDLLIRNGLFLDVVSHPACGSFSPNEKALYLVWWAHRPSHCRVCGSNDRWLPSTDDEYQCDHCSSGNGSTRTNEVVEDVPMSAFGGDYDGDSSQDENDALGSGAGREARGGVQALSGAALVSLFCVYMLHLDSLPKEVRPPTSIYPMILRMATELSELVPLPYQSETQLTGGAATIGSGGGEDGLGGANEGEEEHPGTLIRTASLYIACRVLCPSLVPFPLFIRQAPSRHALTTGASSTNSNTTNTVAKTNATAAPSATRSGAFACQWMDVAALASSIGFILDDFFDSEGTVKAFLTNVMVMIKEFAPTSLSYSPDRDPSRMDYITTVLLTRRNGTRRANITNNNAKGGAGSEGGGATGGGGGKNKTALEAIRPKQRFSPEHTAVFVALELVRVYQRSKEGSKCERMRSWYEANAPLFLPGYVVTSSGGAGAGAGGKKAGYATAEDATYGNLLPSSTWSNLLLWIFARELFAVSPLELCELLMASGLYGGPTRFFEALTDRVGAGFYDVPLQRRLRPYMSPWAALFSALHSEDRLVLMSALHMASQRFGGMGGADGAAAPTHPHHPHSPYGNNNNLAMSLSTAVTTGSKEEQRVVELVQRILRKHGSLHRYQFNYGLKVTDQTEKHFHGYYFASHVSPYCSIYTCLRSGRKTIAFDGNSGAITLSFMGVKNRAIHGQSLGCDFVGPVVASIEDVTAKMVLDLVRRHQHDLEWADAQRRLVAKETVKRRLQSGTAPKIALGELRSILANAAAPMSALTAQCGLVPTGELGTFSVSPFSPLSSSAAGGGSSFPSPSAAASDLVGVTESIIGNSFTNVSPFTPLATPVAKGPPGAFPSFSGGSAQQNQHMSRLDALSQASAQRFAAAMSGGVANTGSHSGREGSGLCNTHNLDPIAQRHLLARYLQGRQRANLLRSVEKQLLLLPVPSLAMGLPVSKQLELFAELHALSEGCYVLEDLDAYANRLLYVSGGGRGGAAGVHANKTRGGAGSVKQWKKKHGAARSGGEDNASTFMDAAGVASGISSASDVDEAAHHSSSSHAPTISRPTPYVAPFADEEVLLNTTIDAVTGANIMLSASTLRSAQGHSPLPLPNSQQNNNNNNNNNQISAAMHVASSTYRLESRYAAEIQLKSTISRYRVFRKTGRAPEGDDETSTVQRRAERRKKRLQQQREVTLEGAHCIQQQQRSVGGDQHHHQNNQHPLHNNGSGGGGGANKQLGGAPKRGREEEDGEADEKVKNYDHDALADFIPAGGLFDTESFSPDSTISSYSTTTAAATAAAKEEGGRPAKKGGLRSEQDSAKVKVKQNADEDEEEEILSDPEEEAAKRIKKLSKLPESYHERRKDKMTAPPPSHLPLSQHGGGGGGSTVVSPKTEPKVHESRKVKVDVKAEVKEEVKVKPEGASRTEDDRSPKLEGKAGATVKTAKSESSDRSPNITSRAAGAPAVLAVHDNKAPAAPYTTVVNPSSNAKSAAANSSTSAIKGKNLKRDAMAQRRAEKQKQTTFNNEPQFDCE